MELAAIDSAFGCARREVSRVVAAWGLGQIADVAELLALELVSSAIGAQPSTRAGYRELSQAQILWLHFQLEPHGLVVATWDRDPRPPQIRQPGTGPLFGGCALYYVPMLAEAWDFYPSAGGKVIWAEAALRRPGQHWLPRREQLRCRTRPAAALDLAVLERVRHGLLRLAG